MSTLFLTGGHGDIGQAIAEKFAENHYQVIAPRSAELNLKELEKIADFVEKLPPLDAFIHCAGFNTPKPFVELELPLLQETLAINALAFYKIVRCLIAQNKLRSNGHILGVSSIYGEVSRKGRFSYSAAKHCLNGMIKTLALELGSIGIKTNGLAPGFVDTKMTRRNNDAATIASFERKIPLGRLAQPAEMANVAYFLATPENGFINGQIIIADGGYLVGGFQE